MKEDGGDWEIMRKIDRTKKKRLEEREREGEAAGGRRKTRCNIKMESED